MSQHTYKYQHKCKAKSVDEARAPQAPEISEEVPAPKRRAKKEAPDDAPAPPKLVRARAAKETVVQEKLPPPEKPVKKRAVIKRQARLQEEDAAPAHPLDVAPKEYQPAAPMDIYQAMLLNRQEQARMHHERMLAPYQQMFSMRR